jgi:TRAP-type uncharacterized transport system substrate-binding protein
LYTEEIHVLVRRDSPLRYVHEVRDARLNLGLPGTGNHLTAARLYERLFGAPLAAANAMHLADAQALQALLDERTIDAMVVVQAQPVRWLAELAPETAQALKLLPFDANHASTRRAIEDYLPARIRAKSYARWLSGDVSTLATMAFMVPRTAPAIALRAWPARCAAAFPRCVVSATTSGAKCSQACGSTADGNTGRPPLPPSKPASRTPGQASP